MARVTDIVISRNIPRNRRLILQRDWEHDEGLIEAKTHLDGSLPGGGVTFYSLMIEDKDSREVEKEL